MAKYYAESGICRSLISSSNIVFAAREFLHRFDTEDNGILLGPYLSINELGYTLDLTGKNPEVKNNDVLPLSYILGRQKRFIVISNYSQFKRYVPGLTIFIPIACMRNWCMCL